MNTSDDGNNNDNINNNNDEHDRRRKGKGRQKIPMEKIENETNRQVTFSKRRAGVFKKASELNTLCGAQSAVVVFSPGNKPHSFGHPSVEAVANRFMNDSNNGGSMQNINAADHLMMAHGATAMHQRNCELVAIEPQLEREKMRKKQLDEVAMANPSLDQLTYEQLEHLKNSVAKFKREFEATLKRNAGETSSWANPRSHQNQGFGFPPPGYGYGTASIAPTAPGGSSSSAPFGYPFDNFGYNVQNPPAGASAFGFNYGYNGVDPAAVVPYDGTGRASGSGSGTSNMMGTTDEDRRGLRHGSPNHTTGFGGNYGHFF